MISNKDKHHVLISDTENITINVDSNITKKKERKTLWCKLQTLRQY